MTLDVWLYGDLARYGGERNEGGFANLRICLPQGSTLGDLLGRLGIPTEERGITFIDGQLSAMPGLQPDLGHVLRPGNRIAFFDLRSMWPFQYRHGVAMAEEMAKAMIAREDHGIHHTYEKK